MASLLTTRPGLPMSLSALLVCYSLLLDLVGYYCIEGCKYLCNKDSYGSEEGLTEPTCTGLCPPGIFSLLYLMFRLLWLCRSDSKHRHLCRSMSCLLLLSNRRYDLIDGQESVGTTDETLIPCPLGLPMYYCPPGSIQPRLVYCHYNM